jgi:DNA repair exonuclease SbcCD ATPase subunit
MKSIIFNNISIKNFLSIGNQPVKIDFKPGLHIITGINKDKEDRRNGVGKSTIADAIYFAVFGETLRGLKKENIINNINRKGCEVVLDFTVKHLDKKEEIQIVRTIEPSKCFLYVNGEDKTRDSIANTTSYIISKISSNPEVFQNCVIMTINNTIPFMAKKKQEKRKFIEDIFNLSIFGNMLDILKADINEKKKIFDINVAKHDEIQKTTLTYEKQKEAFSAERNRKKEKYTGRYENNKKEITDINLKLKKFIIPDVEQIKKDIEENEINIVKADNKLKNIRHLISENTTLILQSNKKIASVGTDKDVCPTCLRTIQEVDRNHIKNEKKKIKLEIENYETLIEENKKQEKQYTGLQDSLDKKIQALRETVTSYKHKVKEKQNLEERLMQLEKWQVELQQDLKDIDNDSDSYDTLIK